MHIACCTGLPMSQVVQYVLWFFAPVVQGCIIAVMLRRGLRREYPIFFAYNAFVLAKTVAEFVVFHISAPNAYFYLYWLGSALAMSLGFMVVHEVFHSVFRPYDSLHALAGVLFRWAAIVLALVAVVSVVSGSSGFNVHVMQAIYALERSVRVMQVGLVLFLFLFAGHVGLSTRSHIVGISLGFGIFAAVDILFATLSAHHAIPHPTLSLIRSFAFNVSCVVWVWYMLMPEPQRQTIDHRARSTEWNFALQAVEQGQHESFLPMIESAVERILQKREAEMRSHP
jgi:hypothetical protein